MPRWFNHLKIVTHPSTNWARRWLTSLIWPTSLTVTPCRQPHSIKMYLRCNNFLLFSDTVTVRLLRKKLTKNPQTRMIYPSFLPSQNKEYAYRDFYVLKNHQHCKPELNHSRSSFRLNLPSPVPSSDGGHFSHQHKPERHDQIKSFLHRHQAYSEWHGVDN